MVFSNLPPSDKSAFFSLLDEYFESRAHLRPQSSPSLPPSGASALHRALSSNQEATSGLVSAGLKHGVPNNSPYAAAANNTELTNAFSRVAVSSLGSRAGSSNRPPTGSSESTHLSGRKFGDVDTSSAKNLFGTLRNSTANKNTTPAPSNAPAALTNKQPNGFAPPPIRRAPSSAVAAPEPEPEPEGETGGEWAEALYDYKSGDAADLVLNANERVLITERTSEDWWTGEAKGKKGLFPASYVKLL